MKPLLFLLSFAGLGVAAALFMFRDAQIPQLHPAGERADIVLIDKALHRMTLMRADEVLAKFPVAVAEPASRPDCALTGVYEISQRNPKRLYRLSLGLEGRTEDLGNNSLIHGRPRVPQAALSLISNKMQGCIGVTNSQMREIWSRVTIGTEVVIQ